MNGPPQKPTTACSGASSRAHDPDRLEHRRERLLRVGDAQPLDVRRSERTGSRTTGPTPSTSSTSRPIATTGVMMSANITAASTPCRRTGCSVTSARQLGATG